MIIDNWYNLTTPLTFSYEPGWGYAGDASVCSSDRPAVWTPGGPTPDQGGLSQCLCRTARYTGKAGARILLGACGLGSDLNRNLPVESPTRNFAALLSWMSSPHLLMNTFLFPLRGLRDDTQPQPEGAKGEDDVSDRPHVAFCGLLQLFDCLSEDQSYPLISCVVVRQVFFKIFHLQPWKQTQIRKCFFFLTLRCSAEHVTAKVPDHRIVVRQLHSVSCWGRFSSMFYFCT